MTRSELQDSFVEIFNKTRKGIIKASIRVGKTRIGLKTIKEGQKVLVTYPKLSIKKSWGDEIEKLDKSFDITFTAFASLHKVEPIYDFIIVDEVHKLSTKQLDNIGRIAKGKEILGLTGTLSHRSIKKLERRGLKVLIDYDLEDGIAQKFVKDYQLYIHFIKLSENERLSYSYITSKVNEEESKIRTTTSSEEKLKARKSYEFFIRKRTELIYNSKTLHKVVENYLNNCKDIKTLIFTLRTNTANNLAEHRYHSKIKDNLENFQLSDKGHLATVNMISEGVTIHHLNHIVCHTITSNTEDFQQKLGRGLQLSEIDDICAVHCFVLKDTVQEDWMESASKSLNHNKIWYIEDGITINKVDYIKALNPEKVFFTFGGSICYKDGEDVRFYKDKVDRKYHIPSYKLVPL